MDVAWIDITLLLADQLAGFFKHIATNGRGCPSVFVRAVAVLESPRSARQRYPLAVTQSIFLIRHGQASAGSANYDRLSALGRRQASLLGDWWQQCGYAPERAFHGSLERQQHTAELTLDAAGLALPCTELTDLNEYNHRAVDAHFGATAQTDPPPKAGPTNFESMTYADYAGVMRRWRDCRSVPESVEPWRQFAARGWNAISAAASAHSNATSLAFFTSGGIIATSLATALDLDFEHCIDAIWRIRNASITHLSFDGEQARLVEFNSITHLEVHQQPDLISLI